MNRLSQTVTLELIDFPLGSQTSTILSAASSTHVRLSIPNHLNWACSDAG